MNSFLIRFARVCSVAALLAFAQGGLAAEAQNTGAPDKSADKEETDGQIQAPTADKPAAQPSPKAVKKPTKRKDNEIFVPSEEISEDFAVSFPVDI